MDSVTQVALIGVAGTVLGGLTGVVGAVRAAGISTRGQSTLEDNKSRRAAYSACATTLIVRRDAISTLMEGLCSGDIDLDTAKVMGILENDQGCSSPHSIKRSSEWGSSVSAQGGSVLIGRDG
ncbi:hypothetical protein [Streptomyces sp. LN704]|uniref:hypothetical protein n=1 Tax=Streptomyces sp. LN704 TaxID=3112982 RepID=UPI00372154A1